MDYHCYVMHTNTELWSQIFYESKKFNKQKVFQVITS